MTKIESADGSAYLSVFTQEKSPLDRMFEGEKLFLTQQVGHNLPVILTWVQLKFKQFVNGSTHAIQSMGTTILNLMVDPKTGEINRIWITKAVVSASILTVAFRPVLKHLSQMTVTEIFSYMGVSVFVAISVNLAQLLS